MFYRTFPNDDPVKRIKELRDESAALSVAAKNAGANAKEIVQNAAREKEGAARELEENLELIKQVIATAEWLQSQAETDGEEFPETDFYDTEFHLDAYGGYRSAKVMVAGGGPTIYVDTGTCEITGFWDTGTVKMEVPGDICEKLDECLEGMFRAVNA